MIHKKPSELINYEYNNKIHNEKQIDLLANSIKEYGMNTPIVIDWSNIIIAWHGRLEACKKLWMDNIPVIIKDNLTDKQIKKYRLLDNKISELADDNIENIKLELDDLDDLELSDLYDLEDPDIDFDDINSNEDRETSNEDRETSKKEQEVCCPDCGKNFNV